MLMLFDHVMLIKEKLNQPWIVWIDFVIDKIFGKYMKELQSSS